MLVGTGRYHDPVIVDGWSGYAYNREQVRWLGDTMGRSDLSSLVKMMMKFAGMSGLAVLTLCTRAFIKTARLYLFSWVRSLYL